MSVGSTVGDDETRRVIGLFGTVLLVTYLPLLTFARFLRGGEGTADLSLVQVGFIVLFVSVVILWAATGITTPFRIPTWTVWVILFLVYSASTVALVAYHGTDILSWVRQWYEFVALFIAVILTPQITNRNNVQYLLTTLLIASTLISMQGVLINVLNRSEGPYPFIFGLTGLPSTLYMWGGVVSFALLISAVHRKSSRATAVLVVAFSIHLGRLFIDLRRLPVLAVCTGVFVVVLLNRNKVSSILSRNPLLTAVTSAIGLVALAWPIFLLSNRLIQRNLLRGLMVRFGASRQALTELSRNPIVGRGFIPELNPGYEILIQGSVKSVETVHNLYVYVLANGGFAGFVLFGLILLSILRLSVRTIAREMDDVDRNLFSAAFGVFVSMLVFFVFSVRGYQIDTMLTLAVVASIISHYSRGT